MTKADKRMFKEYVSKQNKKQSEEIDSRTLQEALNKIVEATKEVCNILTGELANLGDKR